MLCVCFFDPMTSFFLLKMAPQSGARFRAQAPSLVPMYTRIPSQTRKVGTHLEPVSGHECWATFPHNKRRRVTKKSSIPKHLFHHGMAESETLQSGLPGHYPQRQKKLVSHSLPTTRPATAFLTYFFVGEVGGSHALRQQTITRQTLNNHRQKP